VVVEHTCEGLTSLLSLPFCKAGRNEDMSSNILKFMTTLNAFRVNVLVPRLQLTADVFDPMSRDVARCVKINVVRSGLSPVLQVGTRPLLQHTDKTPFLSTPK
jgi:hypothetical protein